MTWEQIEGESGKAYLAFCLYRDIGPQRSLNAGYRQFRQIENPGETGDEVQAPGAWTKWSVAWDWVARAGAYDAYLEGAKRRTREARLLALVERQAEYEFKLQEQAERRVARIEALLDRGDEAPATDLTETTTDADGNEVVSKRKGVNLSGYARLAKESNELAKQCVLGIRPVEPKAVDDAKGGIRKGEFTWKPPVPSSE